MRFEVPVMVSFTNAFSCNVTWCGSTEIYGCFGETCCLRLHIPLVVLLNVEAAGSFKALIDFFRTAQDIQQEYSYLYVVGVMIDLDVNLPHTNRIFPLIIRKRMRI